MPIVGEITPEVLAQDIKRYLTAGSTLAEIQTGALESGVSEMLWQQAVNILSEERVSKSDKKELQKKIIESVFLGVLLIVGGFYGYVLLSLNNVTITDLLSNSPMYFLDKIDQKRNPITAPVQTEDIFDPITGDPITTEQLDPGEVSAGTIDPEEVLNPGEETSSETPIEEPSKEIQILDPALKEKVESGEIVLDLRDKPKQAFSDFDDLDEWLKTEFVDYSGIRKIHFMFDEMGEIVENYVIFYDKEKKEKMLAVNISNPYKVEDGLVYSNKNPDQADENLLTTAWGALFDKINFSSREKKLLNFSMEIYTEDSLKFAKISFEYPDAASNSEIEIEFSEYENVAGIVKIAFGKSPKVSTGFFAEKYPVRRGPRPSPIQKVVEEAPLLEESAPDDLPVDGENLEDMVEELIEESFSEDLSEDLFEESEVPDSSENFSEKEGGETSMENVPADVALDDVPEVLSEASSKLNTEETPEGL